MPERKQLSAIRRDELKQDATGSARAGHETADPEAAAPVSSVQVAALFVATGGVYFGLPGVDPWDETRDARKYGGPFPVVAHPPCERWGRYWSGGPSAKVRRKLGDDGGCFKSALENVRKWGGVLEHPEASHAFAAHGLARARWRAGWMSAADSRGYVCCVAQGNYGHRARKLTWLYAVGCELPDLDWTIPEPRSRLDYGFHSATERKALRRTIAPKVNATRLHARENLATPILFREMLLCLARSSQVAGIRNGVSVSC